MSQGRTHKKNQLLPIKEVEDFASTGCKTSLLCFALISNNLLQFIAITRLPMITVAALIILVAALGLFYSINIPIEDRVSSVIHWR